MVLLDEGLSKIATDFAATITQGQWGTGTADPGPSNTGLGSAIPQSLLSTNYIVSGNSVQYTHELLAGLANGFDLTEFEVRFANSDSLNRAVGGPISKTSSYEIITITSVTFVRN